MLGNARCLRFFGSKHVLRALAPATGRPRILRVLVLAARMGRRLHVYGNGKQVRDILYIDDLVRAFEMATNAIQRTSGQVYNIGGGPVNAVSLLMLVDYLKKEVNPSLEIRHSRWRPGDVACK